MNSALLSLRTRNGANHAQHNITHDLGGSLGRELNGAAPLVIESTRQRRLAHHEQHAVVHGSHIVATLVPRHWEHLWAGTLDVSQPLLDADMERHHVHVWGASNARHRRLQRRRMYPLLATRTAFRAFRRYQLKSVTCRLGSGNSRNPTYRTNPYTYGATLAANTPM